MRMRPARLVSYAFLYTTASFKGIKSIHINFIKAIKAWVFDVVWKMFSAKRQFLIFRMVQIIPTFLNSAFILLETNHLV